jgi:hypothetical protein
MHCTVQHTPPQSGSEGIACHAEHDVGARIGEGGSNVRNAHDEAVPIINSAAKMTREEMSSVTCEAAPGVLRHESAGKNR